MDGGSGVGEQRIGQASEQDWADVLRAVAGALVVAVAMLVLAAALAAFVLDPGTGQVDPRDDLGLVVRGARPIDAQLVLTTTVVALCVLAVAAVPSALRVRHQRRIGQTLVGVLTLLWTGLLSSVSSSLYFWDPDYACRYSSCWPLDAQSWAVAAPAVLLGVSACGAACVPRVRWWVVVGPALVWVGAVAVQRLMWPGVLLPLFSSPPP